MSEKAWYLSPLRITQTVLREIDAVSYDPDSVVQYLRDSHSNCLVVNGGGIFDFFQSPLPMANPVPQLSGRDILSEISQACRKAGIRVICRVDFRGVEKERWLQHQDWFARDADGNPLMTGYTSLPLHAPCYESYYRNEHAEQFISHLLENYAIDGIWHNAVLCRGVCHCQRCLEAYARETGGTMPRDANDRGEDLERYWDWKALSAARNLTRLRRAVKTHGDDKVYTAEVFSMFNVGRPRETGIDLYQARDFFDFLVTVAFLTENQPDPEYRPLQYAGSVTRFLKALDAKRQPVLLWGGNGTSHRYIMDSVVDSRVWLWEAVALGAGFWNCVFNGHHPAATHDRRNAFLGRDAYSFIEKNQTVIDGRVPVQDVTVFYSKPSKDLVGSDEPATDQYCSALQGLEQVLIENHIQYGFLPDCDLSAERLGDVRTLVMPNAALLDDADCELIRRWVEQGGQLVATFETSLYDGTGHRRSDFGLADVLGCSVAGESVDTRNDCYQHIERQDHGLLRGIRDTEVLTNGGETAMTRATTAETVCRHVPIIVNQPPERAWREQMAGDAPTIAINRYGQGTAVYFANQPDRLGFLDGHEDYRTTLLNAIRLLSTPVLETNAPESVHIAVIRGTDGSYMVSLVNHTSAPVRPLRSLVPVSDISIVLDIGEPTGYSILLAETDVTVTGQSGKTIVTVSRLREFCSVVIQV